VAIETSSSRIRQEIRLYIVGFINNFINNLVKPADKNKTCVNIDAESKGEIMQGISLARRALVRTEIASLILASSVVAFSVVAGASSVTGTYNATAAKLVPASFKGVTLQVATDPTYAPDEFMKGTAMVGFDIDLINAVAKTLGVKIHTSNVTFDNIIAGISSGRYQIGNSSFTDNKAREKQVNFVDYFQEGEGVYAKSSSNAVFKGMKSFCGIKVAVETGTVEQTNAEKTAKTCPSSKKLMVMAFPTQTEANTAISSGQATFGFVDAQVGAYIVATSHGVFKSVGSAVNVTPTAIATSKTPAGLGLARAIQAAMKVLIANGTYSAILAHWGVSAFAVPSSKVVLNGALS
jgi:polar amino acid transport system substrate-binding protein